MPSSVEAQGNERSTSDLFGGKRSSGGKKGWKPAPQHLKDMRWVYKNPESPDETASQRSLRKVMTDDFTKFIGMLQQAEKTHESEKAARAKLVAPVEAETKVEATPEDDERDGEVDDLIDRCLAAAVEGAS